MNKKNNEVIVLPPRVPKRAPKCDFCGEEERTITVCTWRYSKKDAKTINYCKDCYLDRKGGDW